MENSQNFATKVAVIGGGIIGISSALRILETPFIGLNLQVTVLAAEFTPHTTGDGSAGFWSPYLFGGLSESTLWSWCHETFEFLLNLSTSSNASRCGIGLLSAYKISEKPMTIPSYGNIFLECRDLTEREFQLFPIKYKFGKFVTTVFAECSKLLPYMMERIKDKGGKLIVRKINDLSELIGEYDVVVNCSGLGASSLVPDTEIFPIRGQTIRVKAPWIKHAVTSADGFYILPNSEEIICGGTHQEGDWNRTVNSADRDFIWKGCCELIPSLKDAEIIREWVGLRPGRSKPRIEREKIVNRKRQSLEIIHNYGHGGSGVTLFWGCAKDVVKCLQQILEETDASLKPLARL